MVDNSAQENSNLREELTGHLSVLMMSILGLGLYSAVYSVTMSLGAYQGVVPILELWMTLSQLGCSLSCLAIQIVVAGMLGVSGGVKGLPNTQVAIFLGLACSMTCIASDCLNGSSFDCQVYYPASIYPPISAVCGIVWSWLMYFAALGVAGGANGFSIGLHKSGGIYAACVMGMLPPNVLASLIDLCGDNSVWKGACSGALGLCGYMLVNIGGLLGLGCVYFGIYIFEKAPSQKVKWGGIALQVVGVAIAIITVTLFIPFGAASLSYRLTAALLAFLTMVHTWRFSPDAADAAVALSLPAGSTPSSASAIRPPNQLNQPNQRVKAS